MRRHGRPVQQSPAADRLHRQALEQAHDAHRDPFREPQNGRADLLLIKLGGPPERQDGGEARQQAPEGNVVGPARQFDRLEAVREAVVGQQRPPRSAACACALRWPAAPRARPARRCPEAPGPPPARAMVRAAAPSPAGHGTRPAISPESSRNGWAREPVQGRAEPLHRVTMTATCWCEGTTDRYSYCRPVSATNSWKALNSWSLQPG